jgi:hypothetical protein
MLMVETLCCPCRGDSLLRLGLMKHQGRFMILLIWILRTHLLIPSLTCRFFLYTFPDDGAELFIKADLFVPLGEVDSKLLYFLNFALDNGMSIIPEYVALCIPLTYILCYFYCVCVVEIGFGAGVFIDVDKEAALRLKTPENSTLATYGRISRDDFKKIINKKDLFLICAAIAGGLTAESASVFISLPPGEIADVADKFIPKLVIGGIDAIVKKEIQIGNTTARMGREMKDVDRLRLESSIAHDSHRALRMLTGCGDDVLPDGFDPDCTVDAKGFACAKLSQISIDAGGLKDLAEKTLGKLVVPNYKERGLNPGFFDEIAQPLLVLDDRLPGISDLAGKR